MPDFVPARELSAAFHAEVVAPLLGGIPHAAALLGHGSDVLGYDDATSTDHGWGPRMQLFVDAADVERVQALVDDGLPEMFRGWPVRFGSDKVAVQHHVRAGALDGWLRGHLGVDPRDGMSTIDWLTVPQQILLEVTCGAVFADPAGDLRAVRETLAQFPPDVHRWLLACQWVRIGQEEAFVGRAAQAGDELGSRVIAARLVRELMRVGFLLDATYWPYTKWFGTAFARLPIADALTPPLERVLRADGLPAREAALVEAYDVVARAHNASGLTEPIDEAVRPYFDRPFLVLGAGRFAVACRTAVTDPELRGLPSIGSVDQVADSTDVLATISRARRLRALYERGRTMTYPVLRQTVLDTTDVRGLAEFYRQLLGFPYRPGDEPPADKDWLVLVGGGTRLAFQQVADLPRTTWPDGPRPQMLHLDMTVPDVAALDAQHDRALALGATLLLDRSGDPDEPLRVYADPDGHPFCLFVGWSPGSRTGTP